MAQSLKVFTNRMLSLSGLLPILKRWHDYQVWLANPRFSESSMTVPHFSLIDAAKPPVIAGLQLDLCRPLVIVTSSGQRALQLQEQTRLWSAFPEQGIL